MMNYKHWRTTIMYNVVNTRLAVPALNLGEKHIHFGTKIRQHQWRG